MAQVDFKRQRLGEGQVGYDLCAGNLQLFQARCDRRVDGFIFRPLLQLGLGEFCIDTF